MFARHMLYCERGMNIGTSKHSRCGLGNCRKGNSIRVTTQTGTREALYLGIQQLSEGHFSHHLVLVVLLNMRGTLQTNSTNTQLVYNMVHYNYTDARVGGIVHVGFRGDRSRSR